jgi:beta-N-acetylhexosaminidase
VPPCSPAPIIFGCAGLTLTPEERDFFTRSQPAGFILFGRNIRNREQVRALVDSLLACLSHPFRFVLIDQEGGRVARLGPPEWPAWPAAGTFGDEYRRNTHKAVLAACYDSNAALAQELAALGITVNCTPVLDLHFPGAHDIIGDRAYGAHLEPVVALARQVITAHLAHGILPVIKHIPGHGRALADSHLALPVVDAPLAELNATDFAPFRVLGATAPWAMTAHIVYKAVDPDRPATLSPVVIHDIIRGNMGFQGVLISDDLNMRALTGGLAANAVACLAAGCDLALHCSGVLPEMLDIAAHLPHIGPQSLARLESSQQKRLAARMVA